MDLKKLKVAILGYGNQGRAHALNLRDSKVSVIVGARAGRGADLAKTDGFQVSSFQDAVKGAEVVVFLLPDQIIPTVYQEVQSVLIGKTVGFAHGFAYHFKLIERLERVSYFLVGPKGAGVILREKYLSGEGLPGVYAFEGASKETESIARQYADAIGVGKKVLIKTTFQEETECDLFGEQAVLCGGIFQLMEKAFGTLVKNGHSKEMAFFETCFEAKLILDLWMKYGPKEVTERISPTAFYGGLMRGKEIIGDEADAKLQSIFDRVRNGEFAKEWMEEVRKGTPQLKMRNKVLADSSLEKVYQELKGKI